MASETQVSNRKRKPSRGGGRGGGTRASRAKQMKTRPQGFPERTKKPKIDKQTKRLFQKRARQYNSDSDSEPEFEEEGEQQEEKKADEIDITEKEEEAGEEDSQAEDEIDLDENDENEDDDDDAVQHGITRFTDGCRAFKSAFGSIIKKSVPDDALGPVLSGHMKLVGEKLAEEESERLAKGVNKKEKQLMSEKGHVKPANFLDSHEKFLIGVATKGVVKLFNAVNKAQNAQKGLNPSRFKDAKELGKRKKRAFFTELRKKTSQGTTSTATDGSDEPAWAPLRDSYMLTNSKLKNWDKMQDQSVDDDMGNAMSHGSSSDED